MENAPLVTIVIPTYNREKFIIKALDSALNQTYGNIEIIVGDNKSTDKTWEILQVYAKKDTRIHIFQNHQNLGPVLNWLECIKRAKGEFLKIIWSDDWISLDYIEKALTVFDKDTAFVLSSIHIVNETNNDAKKIIFRKTNYSKKEFLDIFFISHKEEFPVSPGCALFRTKDIIDSFIVNIPNNDNLDSTKNGAGNDLLLFLNTINRYSIVKTIPNIQSYFRSHGDSFTSSNSSDLDRYYSWALVYFLKKNNYYLYSDIIKYRFYKKSRENSKYNNLYKALNFTNKFLYAFIIYLFYGIQRVVNK